LLDFKFRFAREPRLGFLAFRFVPSARDAAAFVWQSSHNGPARTCEVLLTPLAFGMPIVRFVKNISPTCICTKEIYLILWYLACQISFSFALGDGTEDDALVHAKK
jgi:hypothetical protein